MTSKKAQRHLLNFSVIGLSIGYVGLLAFPPSDPSVSWLRTIATVLLLGSSLLAVLVGLVAVIRHVYEVEKARPSVTHGIFQSILQVTGGALGFLLGMLCTRMAIDYFGLRSFKASFLIAIPILASLLH